MLFAEAGHEAIVDLVALKSPYIRETARRKVGRNANLHNLGGFVDSQRWGCQPPGPGVQRLGLQEEADSAYRQALTAH